MNASCALIQTLQKISELVPEAGADGLSSFAFLHSSQLSRQQLQQGCLAAQHDPNQICKHRQNHGPKAALQHSSTPGVLYASLRSIMLMWPSWKAPALCQTGSRNSAKKEDISSYCKACNL